MKTPTEQSNIPETVMTQLQMKLGQLQEALLAQDPQMPNHLRESHRLLQTYPETVHLLDDEEIGLLIQAVEKHVQVKIVSDVAKGKGSKTKKITADDL